VLTDQAFARVQPLPTDSRPGKPWRDHRQVLAASCGSCTPAGGRSAYRRPLSTSWPSTLWSDAGRAGSGPSAEARHCGGLVSGCTVERSRHLGL